MIAEYAKHTVSLMTGAKKAVVAQSPRSQIARFGRSTLYRYKSPAKNRKTTPVLLVYALVNKPTILDLLPGRSVVETLLKEGRDVFLLDWGEPAQEHAGMGLKEHVLGTLHKTVEGVCREAKKKKTALVGYCMGGTLSVLYTALRPSKVERLFVMAAPIAGRISDGAVHTFSHPKFFNAGVNGLVPADVFAFGFAMLRPVENFLGRYMRFYEHAGDPAFRESFFAMERWMGDGMPLPGAIFSEFVRGIYQEDRLRRGGLRVGKETVDLAKIRCPLGILVAEKDHLVPPASTLALADLVSSPTPEIFRFAGGHAGLAVSGRAHKRLWPAIAAWLNGPRKRGAR